MFNSRNRRSGFTLPEVLVTVAIVAVLAAMVVPAVTQQIGKADAPSFKASAGSLRTAITGFVSDIRALPGQVDHLQTNIATTDFTLSLLGAGVGAPLYTAAQVARWKGPYDNSASSTGLIDMGYGWRTTNVLRDTLGYLVVDLTKSAGADTTDANQLEVAIDGGGVGSNATGMVRYKVGTGAALDPANTIRLFLMSSAR